uniref:Uncharacterized protein n=1 Tax=Rhizophora mucronata TaxID=61149 RepID=A0A2P2PHR4_RHIMU
MRHKSLLYGHNHSHCSSSCI